MKIMINCQFNKLYDKSITMYHHVYQLNSKKKFQKKIRPIYILHKAITIYIYELNPSCKEPEKVTTDNNVPKSTWND